MYKCVKKSCTEKSKCTTALEHKRAAFPAEKRQDELSSVITAFICSSVSFAPADSHILTILLLKQVHRKVKKTNKNTENNAFT